MRDAAWSGCVAWAKHWCHCQSGQTAAEVYAGSDEKVFTALSTGISIAKKKNLISSKTKTKPSSEYTEPPNTLQNFTKSDFLQLSVQQRKQLQYALKELGYYTSSIDGLYGPNTQRAVRAYAKNKGINRNYPISILRQLKAEVSVPSSFATAKKTTSTAVKQGSTKSHYNGLKPLVSNPSLSAKQAWIKCATRANTAHRNAYKSYSTPKYGSTTNCTLNATRTGIIINGNLDCESSPQHGGFAGGINNTLGRSLAAKAAAESTMSSCLTKHGWKR
jgi:peptidoglycan hydrolase-like protein with peptidoglycan-binding domain